MPSKLMVPVELTPAMQAAFRRYLSSGRPVLLQDVWDAVLMAAMTENAQENSAGLLNNSGSDTIS